MSVFIVEMKVVYYSTIFVVVWCALNRRQGTHSISDTHLLIRNHISLDIMGLNSMMTLEIERISCLRFKRHQTTPKRVPCWYTFIFSKHLDNFRILKIYLCIFTFLYADSLIVVAALLNIDAICFREYDDLYKWLTSDYCMI